MSNAASVLYLSGTAHHPVIGEGSVSAPSLRAGLEPAEVMVVQVAAVRSAVAR